jgi:hypothetical protein
MGCRRIAGNRTRGDASTHVLGSRVTRPTSTGRSRAREALLRPGRAAPKGVVWLGFRSFWGHMRHFVASAVATEDVDSRDWMTPDEPEELAQRVVSALGASNDDEDSGPRSNADVLSALGRDLWIDYVSDTGRRPLGESCRGRARSCRLRAARPGQARRAPRGATRRRAALRWRHGLSGGHGARDIQPRARALQRGARAA